MTLEISSLWGSLLTGVVSWESILSGNLYYRGFVTSWESLLSGVVTIRRWLLSGVVTFVEQKTSYKVDAAELSLQIKRRELVKTETCKHISLQTQTYFCRLSPASSNIKKYVGIRRLLTQEINFVPVKIFVAATRSQLGGLVCCFPRHSLSYFLACLLSCLLAYLLSHLRAL